MHQILTLPTLVKAMQSVARGHVEFVEYVYIWSFNAFVDWKRLHGV